MTLSCEISDLSPITCINSHYRVRGQSMVCVLYIHNVNPKMQLKAMWIHKMVAGYNRKWRRSIRHTGKPHPRTKHEVNRTTRRWDIAIWNFLNGRRPPSWIWPNRKWRHLIRRPRNPTLETNTKSIGRYVAEIWPFEFFSKWPPAAILDLIQPEMAPFDPPSTKTPP